MLGSIKKSFSVIGLDSDRRQVLGLHRHLRTLQAADEDQEELSDLRLERRAKKVAAVQKAAATSPALVADSSSVPQTVQTQVEAPPPPVPAVDAGSPAPSEAAGEAVVESRRWKPSLRKRLWHRLREHCSSR